MVKERFKVNLQQLEVLRKVVLELNKLYEAAKEPGRFRIVFDQNFGIGKVVETVIGDYNVWIGYRKEPNSKLFLTHWFEWLITVYFPTFTIETRDAISWSVSSGGHPIDILSRAVKAEPIHAQNDN